MQTSSKHTGNFVYENKYLCNNANQRFAVFREGKELQEDFGLKWLDYRTRFYDAELGKMASLKDSWENIVNSLSTINSTDAGSEMITPILPLFPMISKPAGLIK